MPVAITSDDHESVEEKRKRGAGRQLDNGHQHRETKGVLVL